MSDRTMVQTTLGRPYTLAWRIVHCDRCPTREGAGGYSFWRCERLRFHPGAHRFKNYAWPRGFKVMYDPRPVLGLNEDAGYSWRTGAARKAPKRGETPA